MAKTPVLQVDYDTKSALPGAIDGLSISAYETMLQGLQVTNPQAYRVARQRHDVTIAQTYRY